MKSCYKCGKEKNEDCFSVDRSTKDRLQNCCKECQSLRDSKYRKTNKGKEVNQKGIKKYRKTRKGKEAHSVGGARYRQKYPEKIKAGSCVGYAIKLGKLVRPDVCEQCDTKCKPEAHHPDYDKPLDVTWMCIKCHKKLHRKESNGKKVLV